MRSLLGRLVRDAPRQSPPKPFLEAVGVCPVCDSETVFRSHDPWLRDHFVCENCGSVPRERALMTVLELVRPGWRSDRIHESSPSSRGSVKLLKECPGYVATHYDPAKPRGEPGGDDEFRNEDLEAQTFPDESFDVVVTQDVFEHLFEPGRAIAEIARTLAPGGVHVCTVPLGRGSRPSQRRAIRDREGAVAHLEPAIFHHNPIDPAGSLVTIDWGFDIANYFLAHGGLATTVFRIDDLTRGIRAELNDVVVSYRGGVPSL